VSAVAPVVVKFGGELVETPERLNAVGEALAALAASGPLVVVHGGGREIDAELARRGVAKQAVDGLRITDAPTLDAVVAVLGGTINTRLVAHLVARGLPAIGLTGVDTALARSTRAAAHVTAAGAAVDLGLVGGRRRGVAPARRRLRAGDRQPRGRRRWAGAERQRRHAGSARGSGDRRAGTRPRWRDGRRAGWIGCLNRAAHPARG
jgi:acetylglutamate kinase